LLVIIFVRLLVVVTCVQVRKSLAIIRTICFFITPFFFLPIFLTEV
ncbi:unnamed protein product, partial [Gulo gulo]